MFEEGDYVKLSDKGIKNIHHSVLSEFAGYLKVTKHRAHGTLCVYGSDNLKHIPLDNSVGKSWVEFALIFEEEYV